MLKSDECSRVDNMKQLGPERLIRSGRVVRIQQRCVNDNLFDQSVLALNDHVSDDTDCCPGGTETRHSCSPPHRQTSELRRCF